VLGYFFVLKSGSDLIGLSAVFFLASIVYSFGSDYLLKKFVPNKSWREKVTVPYAETKALFLNGGKILILNLVGILVLNKDIYLIERFQGLTILPLFGALSRIQSLIMAVSLMIPQMIFPFVAQSFAVQDYKKTFNLYWTGVILAVASALVLSIIIFSTANLVVPLWLGKGNYLGNSVLFLLLAFGLLVIHHNAHASAILATGANYFMWPAIINAILSLPFSIIGIKYFGIEGMIMGNILATILPSGYVVIYSMTYFAAQNKKLTLNKRISNA
jgi:O-antigen/teichoic acid export membrane protein